MGYKNTADKLAIKPRRNGKDETGSGSRLLEGNLEGNDSSKPLHKITPNLSTHSLQTEPTGAEATLLFPCEYNHRAGKGISTPKRAAGNCSQMLEKLGRIGNRSLKRESFSTITTVLVVALIYFTMFAAVFLTASDSPRYQLEQTHAVTQLPVATETTRKRCRQIGTEEACSQNEKCTWIMRKHCCEEAYIKTVQFGEKTVVEPLLKESKILAGNPTTRSDVRKWALGYSNFIAQYKKKWDLSRFEIYQKNVEEVIRHNNQYLAGATTWWTGINSFSDMTEKELKAYTGYLEEPHEKINISTMVPPRRSSSQFPQSFDCRKKGIVTPVKDQGRCGSGFAFAAVAAMESKYAMLSHEIVDLSEQHVLDCSHSSGNNSCHGDNFKDIFNFLQHMSVDTEANIPYEAVGDRGCRDPRKKYDNRILDWKSIEPNEEAMKEAIFNYGPIVASLTVDSEFFSYEGGVFTAPNNTMPNHAVLVVGYGKENGTDVWYIKNSWGENWGQKGFMSIQRNLRGLGHESYVIIDVENTWSGS